MKLFLVRDTSLVTLVITIPILTYFQLVVTAGRAAHKEEGWTVVISE